MSFADAFPEEAKSPETFGALFGEPKQPKSKAKTPTPGPGVDVAGAPLMEQSARTRETVLADVAKGGDGSGKPPTFNGMALDGTIPPVAAAPPVSATPPSSRVTTGNKLRDEVAGAGETAWTVGSGLASSAAGGLAGIAGSLLPGPEGQGAKWSKAVQEAGTYQPKTAEGQRNVAALGKIQEPFDKAGDWAQAGTEATGAAGSGVMGAVSKAGLSNLPMLLGVGARTSKTAATAEAAPKGAPPVAPGEVPTLANASPELQQAIAQVKNAPQDAVARHVEADTLPVPGKLTTGQAAQDPSLISREMNGRGKDKPSVPPAFYQEQGKTVAANMDAIRNSAAPDVPVSAKAIDHGQTLLDAYKTKDAAATADISAKYKALTDANGGTLPLDGKAFVANVETSLSKNLKTGSVPADLQSALNEFKNGRQMTFEDFETLRSDAADAMRTSTDGRSRAAAGIIRQELESLPLTAQASELKPLADSARSAAKARFDAIEADPAYKAAVNDSTPLGHPSPAADRFFDSFVLKGKRENVARLKANLADSPEAAQTIAAGTLDHLKSQMKADPVTGNFSSANYGKAMETLGPKMENLVDPATAQQLRAVGGFAKNAQTQPRGSYVNNSNTAVELAAGGAKFAAEHGTNALFGGVPVGTVVRKAGSFIADRAGVAKASNQALDPRAGLTSLSELMKK